MSCRVENISYDNLRNAIRHKELIFDNLENQTREESIAKLNMVSGVIEKDYSQDGLYVFSGTKDIALKTTITKMVKGGKDFILTKDRQTTADLGVAIHSLYERFVPAILEAKLAGKKFNRLLVDTKTGVKVDDAAIDKIVEQATELVDLAIATQNNIDPNQNVIALTEFKIVDPMNSVGGTGDLIFIYSDNTYSYFDFKNMGIRSKSNVKTLKDGFKVHSDPVMQHNLDYWEGQTREIDRMLVDLYGLKKARHVRTVVSMMEVPMNHKAPKGEKLLPHIKNLVTGEDNSFLGQIPMSFETTGNKAVDKFLNTQFALLEKIIKDISRTNNEEKKYRLFERANKIRQSIKDIKLNNDIASAIKETQLLITGLAKRIQIEEESDSLYMHIDEIQDTLKVLEAYDAEFREAMQSIIDQEKQKDDLTAEDKERLAIEYTSINTIKGRIDGAIHTLKAKLQDREIANNEKEFNIKPEYNPDGSIKNTEITNVVKLQLKTLTELGEDNYFFNVAARRIGQAQMEASRDYKVLYDDLMAKHKALLDYGKSTGKSVNQVYKMIYNEKTGSLHFKLKKDFYDLMAERFKSKDHEWYKEHYQLKEGAEENIKERRNRYYEQKKSELEQKAKEDFASIETIENELDILMHNWDTKFNTLTHEEAWVSDVNKWTLELKPEVIQKYASDEYKSILNTPQLKEYYELYQELNSQIREWLGVKWSELPDHFIANVRADLVQMAMLNGEYSPSALLKEFTNSFKVREGDYMYNLDLNGKIVREIPKLYLNPVENKSFDLTSNMIRFLQMGLNYKAMSKQEAHILALKTIMMENKATVEVKEKSKMSGISRLAKKAIGLDPNDSQNQQAFNALVDYHLYGVTIQDTGVASKGTVVKTAQTVKTYTGAIQLMFKPITGASAWLAAKINTSVEATKGEIFSRAAFNQAQKLIWSDRKKTLAIVSLFDMGQDNLNARQAMDASATKLSKWLSMEMGYYFLRKADESIDHHVAVAMFLHYGFNSEGKIRPLSSLPQGTKSLYDQISVDPKTGRATMDINDNQFYQIRNALRKGQRKIKGTMSSEDVNKMHTGLLTNMFMQFKTWMPGVARERFSNFKFDETLGIATIGRYNAFWHEINKEANQNWTNWITHTLLKKMSQLMIESATFGLHRKINPNSNIFTVNEMRAKRLYNQWKAENPSKSKDVSFEDFKRSKQNQLRAMASEVRMMIGLLILISLMAGADDEDENGQAKNYAFRILNRAYTEVSFFYDFNESARLLGTASIPSVSILYKKLNNWFRNTKDEIRDYSVGENFAGDDTPPFARTLEFIPIISAIRSMIPIFPVDEEKER